ncbi:MAG: carboxypeptidase-like regulatory domain-containing protein [Tabrizicola sp.]|jgi:hypothetical protein|nr:carboxypeptidase-like regulatory domain-containing protein [Tabrizicola sp.]
MARDPLSRQIIIAGQITDALSAGRPRARPVMEVSGPPGLLLRLAEDLTFSVSAQPDIAMPLVGDRVTLDLQVDGYQAANLQVVLTAADLQRSLLAVVLGGEPAELPQYRNLPITRNIALLPRPVALKGRVADAEDPGVPLAGATVRVTAPVPSGPVQTNALGFFSLPAVPVAAEITLRISAPNYSPSDISYRPDFNQPINQGAFALSPL